MKKMYRYMLFLSFLLATAACTKRDYFVDGGLASQPEEDKQKLLYDYLKSKPGIFDSLVAVIDAAGLQSLVNQDNITFFGATNQSIIRFQTGMNKATYAPNKNSTRPIADIGKDTLALLVKRFILGGVRLDLETAYKRGNTGYLAFGGDSVYIKATRGYFQNIAGNGAMSMQYQHVKTAADTVDFPTSIQTHNLITRNAILHVMYAGDSYLCGLKVK